ncbi:TonB-dependent receptor [Novosphingobium soli]|uniref:TonB-dependent receptor n=1 Tax=Novosphingobium soli TaxID=574956 RepID=A0ABV6CV34_9SPHN
MNFTNLRADYRALLLATAAGLLPTASPAQDAAPAADEPFNEGTITVTARKQSETLVEAPLSIQAFTAEDIRQTGARDLQELSKFTPGMFFVNGAQGQGARTISEVRFRGLSTSIPSPTNQSGSVFIDGNYVLSGGQSLDFTDIAQIEVIKGPQAAYFGRSTFAGAVNFTTRDPSDHLRADTLLDYSPSYDSYQIAASIEGPLAGDTLTARLSGSSKVKGSQYTASDGGKLGEEKTRSANLTLVFRPSSSLKVKLRGSYIENEDSASDSIFYAYNTYGNCPVGTPMTVQTTGGRLDVRLNRRFQCGNIPFSSSVIDKNTALVTLPAAGALPAVNLGDVLVGNSLNDPLLANAPSLDHFGLHSITYRIAGNVEYDIAEGLSFSGNASYAKQRIAAIQDTDGTPSPAGYQAIPMDFEDAGFEARLRYTNDSWLNATVGANYFLQNIQASTDTGVSVNNQTVSGATVIRGVTSSATNQNDKIRTLGLFFGADVTPVEWFTLTAEGRYQVDDYTTFGGSNASNNLVASKLTTKRFTPRVIASFHPVPDATIYGSYSYAFLPGVINSSFLAQTPPNQAAILAAFPDFQIQLSPEKLTNYEVGVKKSFDTMRAYFTLAAFKMKWDNVKTSNAIIVPTLANPVYSVTVPGTAEIKGIEFEGGLSPLRQLALKGSLGYIDAKYKDYTNRSYNTYFSGIPTADTYKADGNQLPRTPTWTGTASATWEDGLVGDWSYRLRGDVVYQGRQYTDETNITTLAAFTTLNAAVEFFSDDLSVKLYAANLFDKKAWLTGRRYTDLSSIPLNFATAGIGSFLTPNDRREVGIQVRKSF